MELKRKSGFGLAKQSFWTWMAFTLFGSLAFAVWQFTVVPPSVEAWHLWTRYTARLSFFLFLISYLAAPLYQLRANTVTSWLRRHRRNAGISFAIAHIIHLFALIGFFSVSGETVDIVTLGVGGGAYLAMFLMLISSNDAAIRKLGADNWHRLHKLGAHYLAVVFAITYLSHFLSGLSKPTFLIVLAFAAIVLRVYVDLIARQETSS